MRTCAEQPQLWGGLVDLPEDAGFRLELLSLEMTRLLDLLQVRADAGSGVGGVR